MRHLTVQTGWYWDAEFIGYFIAQSEGIYERAGIDVTFLEGGADIIPDEKLLDGGADIAITVRDTTRRFISEGKDLEVIAAQYKTDPLTVLVPDGSTVDTLADLLGLRLAVPEVSKDALLSAFARAGLDRSKVRTTPFEGSMDVLQDGEADAVVGYATTLPLDLQATGTTTREVPLPQSAEDPQQNLIVARRTRSKELDRTIDAWLWASAEGWRKNAVDPTKYPRDLRSAWFAAVARSVEDEIAHNIRQLEFMGDPECYLGTETPTHPSRK